MQRDEESLRVSDIKGPEGEWNISNLSFDLPSEIRDELIGIPRSIAFDIQDVATWKYSSNGQFSTRSAYLLACGWNPQIKDEGWKWIWKSNSHPRIQFFIWQCYHGKLLTAANLAHRGMNVDPVCAICKLQEESNEHVFRGCPIAIEFWRKLGIPQSKRATFRVPFGE